EIDQKKNLFQDAMDDDLNISGGLAAIFDLVKELNKLLAEEKMSKADAELCIEFFEEIDRLLEGLRTA
ncbi:MAG: DALR domain-containing protein, partial [Bacteroidota bacterium]